VQTLFGDLRGFEVKQIVGLIAEQLCNRFHNSSVFVFQFIQVPVKAVVWGKALAQAP
jgi:hypothetical protein